MKCSCPFCGRGMVFNKLGSIPEAREPGVKDWNDDITFEWIAADTPTCKSSSLRWTSYTRWSLKRKHGKKSKLGQNHVQYPGKYFLSSCTAAFDSCLPAWQCRVLPRCGVSGKLVSKNFMDHAVSLLRKATRMYWSYTALSRRKNYDSRSHLVLRN